MSLEDLEEALTALILTIRVTIRTEFTSIWLPIQLGAILLGVGIALALAALIRRRFDLTHATMGWPAYLRLAARAVIANIGVILFIMVVPLIGLIIRALVDHPRLYLLGVASDLATAWVVINIIASLIRNQFVNRIVAISAWTIAALSILRLLDPVTASLDSLAFTVGDLRITPLLVMKTVALMLVTFWIANVTGNFLDRRVRSFSDLTPSIQVLIGKFIRIGLLVLAVIIVLRSVGIDLSVLAVFSGAVGVGIGFGLQKIVSNLVSGIILLADKSIKPGDIIAVGDQFGTVGNMGARYTSVDTRDGRQFLIPNDDFVTQRVVNWTYSDDRMRLEIKFGTTYAHSPRRSQAAAIEAALSVPRVMKTPPPACHVVNYGDKIEYVLWFWIKDPSSGVSSVRSEVHLALWDAIDRGGLDIPRPGHTPPEPADAAPTGPEQVEPKG